MNDRGLPIARRPARPKPPNPAHRFKASDLDAYQVLYSVRMRPPRGGRDRARAHLLDARGESRECKFLEWIEGASLFLRRRARSAGGKKFGSIERRS